MRPTALILTSCMAAAVGVPAAIAADPVTVYCALAVGSREEILPRYAKDADGNPSALLMQWDLTGDSEELREFLGLQSIVEVGRVVWNHDLEGEPTVGSARLFHGDDRFDLELSITADGETLSAKAVVYINGKELISPTFPVRVGDRSVNVVKPKAHPTRMVFVVVELVPPS